MAVRRITFRLYPNQQIEKSLRYHRKLHKDLYNAAVYNRFTQYEKFRYSVDYMEQQSCLPEFKEFWTQYQQINSQALQATLKRVDYAFTRWFAGLSKRPKFKSIRHYSGWTYPAKTGYKVESEGENGYLNLTNIGHIQMRGKAKYWRTPTTCTIVYRNGKWYASITVEVLVARLKLPPEQLPTGAVGIDFGCKSALTITDGENHYSIEASKFLRNKYSGEKNVESTKTYVDQIEFWHWGELFALSNLVDSARKYCLELILKRKGKLECNKELQAKFNLNKRWANSVYTEVQAIVINIDENRTNHIKVLEGQIKSIKSDIRKREKQIKDFANQEKYEKSKRSKKCFSASKLKIKKACNINAKQRQSTQLQDAKFVLHQKKRRLYLLENQLKHLTNTKPNYVLPDANGFVLIGSKDETSGNQSAQFDYNESTDKFILSIRTPYALEERLGGEYVRIDGLTFKHGHHEIIQAISQRCYQVKTKDKSIKWNVGCSAVTLRFYWKNDCWYVAATTDIHLPDITSEYLSGYIGIDLNADSAGWAVCDAQGNLLEFGDYKIELHSKTSNQREAILSDAATFIVLKARQYNFPIASEKLDFSDKKVQLKEKGRKYARMLSSFAYSGWNCALDNACQKYGIYHKKVNPAYSSFIGLTKFMSMYGMNSSSAAAFVMARRGRRFSERLPNNHCLLPYSSAYTKDNKVKHVWSHWSKVARSVKGTPRHKYFTARLNRTRKVTLDGQLSYPVTEPRLSSNPIQLELFEVSAILMGKDAVSVAASRSRKKTGKRKTFTPVQISLDLNER